MKVLLVEDYRDARVTLKRQLEIMGYEVIEAEDGLEAYGCLEEGDESVDLIVAAWEYYEVRFGAKKITLGEGFIEKAKEKNPNVKTILMTADPGLKHLDYLKSIGADYVLVKSFGYRDLCNALEIVKAATPAA